jgi:hypothetical protein
VLDSATKHGFVEIALNRAGEDRSCARRHGLISEQCELLRLWRPGLGKHGIGKRHAAFNQSFGLGHIGRHFDTGTLGVRIEEQDFIEANSFVAQQVGRVRTNEYLPAVSTLHCREHWRQEANDIRM